MPNNPEPQSSVHIGNVTGGIHGSIIAGHDVNHATIMLGGQPTSASKEPTVDDLKQLLAEVHQELADLLTQQETLKQISPAAPFTAHGAEQTVKAVTETVDKAKAAGQTPEKEEAQSLQTHLTQTTNLLSSLLDGAKTLAQKAGDVARAVTPLAEQLGPLVEKVAVAALWVGKLWL
jgi:flagellar biosynthesis/type III secretory pathway protein FliH